LWDARHGDGSTSLIEKQNHTLRMHCQRLTRLTNACSKKLENFKGAVALNFAYTISVKSTVLSKQPGSSCGNLKRPHGPLTEFEPVEGWQQGYDA